VDKDARLARMPQAMWTGLLLGGGVAGLLIWLLVPMYLVGLGVFVVLVAAVGATYVMQRNAHVLPSARVLTAEHLRSLFQQRKETAVKVQTRLKLYDHSGRPALPPVDGDIEEKNTYNLAQELLYDLIWRRASEAVLGTAPNATTPKYVIDGVVVPREPMERADAASVIDYLKRVAGMDLEDKRRPQTGKLVVDLAGQPIDINVATAGSVSGQKIQFKIVQESVRTHLGELGMSPGTLKQVQETNTRPKGLIIVSSRPRNGMTSTLYSLLRDNDAYIKQLVSVEEDPEVDLENITQKTYKGPPDLPGVLAGVMRRDPDVVMVDKCPDQAAAKEVLAAAREKKVLLGLHAGDSFIALAKWAKLVGDVGAAVAPLQAVLCQSLLRKLCPACREAYRPNAEMLRKANLPADKPATFYRPPTKPLTDEKGNPIICATCQGIGYLGRTAAFELLEMDEALRKLVVDGANLTQIKAAARKNKMIYLQEQALGLVMQGVTSIQEVIRVSRDKQPQG